MNSEQAPEVGSKRNEPMSAHRYFAVAVATDDMHPRMQLGESVLFTSARAVRADDDVLIVFENGSYAIRELIDIDERRIVVHTYSPDVTSEIPRSRVAHIYPIVARYFEPLEDLIGHHLRNAVANEADKEESLNG
jgi:phage repressor protein C with HTH and peptisase S24 domain